MKGLHIARWRIYLVTAVLGLTLIAPLHTGLTPVWANDCQTAGSGNGGGCPG